MATTHSNDDASAGAAARQAGVARIEAAATSRWPHPVFGYPRPAASEPGDPTAEAARRRLDRGEVPAVPWKAKERDIAGIEYVPWVQNTRMYPTGIVGDTPHAIIVAAEAISADIRELYGTLELPRSAQIDLDTELHEIAWAVAHTLELSTSDAREPRAFEEERWNVATEVRDALIDHVAALELHRTQLEQRVNDRREVQAQCQQEALEQQRRVEVLDPPDLSKAFGAVYLHQQAAARISQYSPDSVAVPTSSEVDSRTPRGSLRSFLSRHQLAVGYLGIACGVAVIILLAVGYATAPRFGDQTSAPYGPPPDRIPPGVKVVPPGEQSYLPDGTPWTVPTLGPGCYWNEAASGLPPTGRYGWQACGAGHG